MRTAFFDVDTQIDFMFPAGALYVPGAETVLPAISRLNQFAVKNGHILISDTDAHAEDDPEFHHWPAHCVVGTVGQMKVASTLATTERVVVPNRRISSFSPAPQIVLEKNVLDAFANPNLDSILDTLRPERCVVYGVVTEICVRCALWGLLKRGGTRIELVTDAVRSLDEAAARGMIEEFTAQGGVVTTTAAVCG